MKFAQVALINTAVASGTGVVCEGPTPGSNCDY